MKREKILVIKLGALGDVMMYTGYIHAVVRRHPEADITMMTHAAFVPLMRQSGWFSDFFLDNRCRYSYSELRRICYDFLAKERFDVIYDLQSSHRTLRVYYPLVRFLTRNPLVWAKTTPDGLDFVRTPAKRAFSWGRARIEHVAFDPLTADISFCHGEHRHFDLLPENYVLIIPGCSPQNPEKRWPADRYRALSNHFGAKGLKSVVLGTTVEAAEIETVVRDNPYAIDFMNKASLADVADLARGAEIVIGNDTGPSHMARLAGARTVLLFCDRTKDSAVDGPNVVNLFGRTISDISVQETIQAMEALCVR